MQNPGLASMECRVPPEEFLHHLIVRQCFGRMKPMRSRVREMTGHACILRQQAAAFLPKGLGRAGGCPEGPNPG